MDGIEMLKAQVKQAPTRPGVYRMLNEAGDVLYVGKAKNLKNRLMSYTRGEGLSTRIRKMVFETRQLMVVETATEVEALLLEANLIKSLKPKYNIIFRDDANYISVLITDEESPQIRHHRGAKRQKGDYFGPYPSADAVYRTIETLEKAFKLRTCKPSVFAHRTRPCLKYDIKRCSAPCVGKISKHDYAQSVRLAKDFLRGRGTVVHQKLQKEMKAASANLDYEKAAGLRDTLQALSAVHSNRTALTHAIKNGDVFAVVVQGGKACVQGFFYRNGQHVGNHTFFPRATEGLDEGEVLQLFLALHYGGRPPPPVVYCSHMPSERATLEEALRTVGGHRVRILQPQRGEKLKIVEQALRNAEQALARRQAEGANWGKQMAAFGEILDMNNPPELIECFDISNISGQQAVASLVVAGAEGMEKQRYRKFTIKSKNSPDDYAMMQEALHRRYSRLIKEESSLPDVVLVDGGVGHLNVLVTVMKELDLLGKEACPVLCAIAKGEERDKGLEQIFQYRAGETVNLRVPLESPLIFVLQRIRDEAHRFAIGFHRQKRGKVLTGSALDDVPGVGGKRKKALLLHFGSVQGVKDAGVEELARVEGVSSVLAQAIYDFFH